MGLAHSHPPQLPEHSGKWITTSEAALIWGRAVRTIRLWCDDGTFAAANIRVHKDNTTERTGEWWICLPHHMQR